MRRRIGTIGIAISAMGVGFGGCAVGGAVGSAQTPNTAMLSVLDRSQVAFGSMVSDRTEAGGAALGADARVDFAFYDMERRYDLAELQAFMRGFRGGGTGKTLLVRIAPIANGREAAQQRRGCRYPVRLDPPPEFGFARATSARVGSEAVMKSRAATA